MLLCVYFSKCKKKGEDGYDPLFKVKLALDAFDKGNRAAWNAGKCMTIDESMIRCMGRAVEYVQYMPIKPIKHTIKVYAFCCAVSGVMLAWKVYMGSLDGTPNTTIDICDELVQQADLTKAKGRVL